MKFNTRKLFLALATLVLFNTNSRLWTVSAQGSTAFTYQGQLRDNGTNANGTYTMVFNLYDSLSGGNLIGGPITTSPTLANGLFTVNLDFGAGAFNGSARYLDITITSGGETQELSPRVQVLPSPYAQFAAIAGTVTNGAITSAQLAANAVNANSIASGQVVKSLNGLSDAVSLSAGANVTIAPSGNTLQISSSGGGGIVVTNAIAAGNNVGLFTNSGIVQISAFVPNAQVFSTPGTNQFIIPPNVTKIMVELWGAGGGGGSGSITNRAGGGTYAGGGGGGAGGYAKIIYSVSPGQSYTVIVGQGGTNDQNGGFSAFGSGVVSSTNLIVAGTGGHRGTSEIVPDNGGVSLGQNGGSGGNPITGVAGVVTLNVIQGGNGRPANINPRQAIPNGTGDGGTAPLGGSGGYGDSGFGNPQSGSFPGGGGGGSVAFTDGSDNYYDGVLAGSGANGQVVIYW